MQKRWCSQNLKKLKWRHATEHQMMKDLRNAVNDRTLLDQIGPDEMDELDEVEMLTYIKEQAHLRGLEFYTANYRALSDSPICCGAA